jgi:hypothetical protein
MHSVINKHNRHKYQKLCHKASFKFMVDHYVAHVVKLQQLTARCRNSHKQVMALLAHSSIATRRGNIEAGATPAIEKRGKLRAMFMMQFTVRILPTTS